MRRSVALLVLSLKTMLIFGQGYASDWINYSQTYYKIPIVEKGIYRIGYDELQNANFPVDAVDPRNIQLFHRGEELKIEVTGQGDARFDTGDYIQFYAQGNDGTLDADLYRQSSDQPHQYYNLYSDTTAYFLTWTLDTTPGKRIDTFFENNVTAIPAEAYHNGETLLVNTEEYATGNTQATYIQRTAYDQGEGWSGHRIQENEQIDYTLTGINGQPSTVDTPSIQIQLMGRDDWTHRVELLVGPNAGALRQIATVQFRNYETYTIDEALQWSDISAGGELIVRARALGISGLNDLVSVNYIKLDFPQLFDMSGRMSMTFNLQPNPDGKSYIEVENIPASLELWDITDLTSASKIGYNSVGSDLNAIVPNTTSTRRIWASNVRLSPISITQFNFERVLPDDFNYIIISHQAMMRPAGAYGDVVSAYADYRASEAGGGYLTGIFDIDDIYNQFNYGERSPLAIHELMRYLVEQGEPKYLLIIGKGLLINTSRKEGGETIYYRNAPGQFTSQDLIPPAGVPGSDLTYTIGLAGAEGELAVPTGRITATQPIQVADYLDKVKAHESQPIDDLWRKRILHLSGGKTFNEQVRFKGYVDQFKTIAEGDYLGGIVSSLKKQTNAVDEFINVTEEINNGVGLITFYGHSAPNITDIDIGFVSNPILEYDNKDKYPLILVNGCNAGQVYNTGYLWGEDWVFTPDKGAIGFIANSYFAFEGALREYSNIFYQNAFADQNLISQSIGNIQQQVIKDYLSRNGVSISNEAMTQQMILKGDPAVAFFGADKPDYSTNNNSVYFQEYNSQPINALADSFAVAVIAKNFGRSVQQDLNVRVKRRLEDNTVINYDTVFSPVLNQDTLFITIKNDVPGILGRNIFEVELDDINAVDELDETNNTAVLEKNLLSNGTKNLFPIDFAMINSTNVELTVQSANTQSDVDIRGYTLELDTVSTFSSAYKKTQVVNARTIAKWEISLLTRDSTTYYWRTKLTDPKPGESTDWEVSSFTYIAGGQRGWMQIHRQQYQKNLFNGVKHDQISDIFSFENITSQVAVTTYGADHPTQDYQSVELKIDNQQYIYETRLCRNNTINLVAFNKLSTTPYAPIPSSFNTPQTCGRTDQIVNSFTYQDITGTNDYLTQAIDAIEDGDIVLLFSIGDIQFDDWDTALQAQIERVGGLTSTISVLEAGAPYIMIGKKGSSPGTAIEVISSVSPASEQSITIDETITAIAAQGQMTSSIIGPSTSWQTFLNRIESDEEDYQFHIYGIDYTGRETLLFTTDDQIYPVSTINTTNYPYLKLSESVNDPTNLTAAQLQHWSVTYSPVPEGVLLMKESLSGRIAEEGETITVSFDFVNISAHQYQRDLLATYTITNRSAGKSEEKEFTIEAPTPGDTTTFTLEIPTIGKAGFNDLFITVNPRIEPEQYYDNNQLQLLQYIEVIQDQIPPSVDVTFDGAHITNGGVVSINPAIEITIHDNNESILMTDTLGVNVYFKANCEGCDYQRITYNSDSVDWTPSDENQEFKILFTPRNLSDSVYHLRVLASDASGNSTQNPYEIAFTIDKEPAVRYFHPYPNPSAGKVSFTFELRGASPPDQCEIYIYDNTANLVEKITQTDLRIGLNSIELNWATDTGQFSSGMFIYKIRLIDKEKQISTLGSIPARGKLLIHR